MNNNTRLHLLAPYPMLSCIENILIPIAISLNVSPSLKPSSLRSWNDTKSWYGSSWLRHIWNKEASYLISNRPTYNVNRGRMTATNTSVWKRRACVVCCSHRPRAVLKPRGAGAARFPYCGGVRPCTLGQRLATVKGRMVHILGFAGHVVPVATPQVYVVAETA